MTIFDTRNKYRLLNQNVKYKYIFKKHFIGSTMIFKFFSPSFLYRKFINEEYDILVSYLEGPTARILSGCENTNIKKIAWIHTELY